MATAVESPVEAPPPQFKPYVPNEVELPELTFRALALGSFLGLIFGASSVYLALRVGLTVSASVPIAVLSITIFRAVSKYAGGRASILENTVVQTTGSAGESIAAGVAFTLPALVLLGFEMDWTRTLMISLCGGILGVLMMIPLRRYLIVKEHGVLTYPEGTACAEVLVAGEERGAQAKLVFQGLFVGLGSKFLTAIARLWPGVPELHLPRYKAAQLSVDLSPELMGVGYIIGYRSAAIMVGGGLLSWLVLIPAIALFGEGRAAAMYPSTVPIDQMLPGDIWARYIRYIGAGAVAAGGIINLVKGMPTIIDSFRASFRDLKLTSSADAVQRPRTERDIPISVVLIGSVVLALLMSFLPQLKAVPGVGIAMISAVAIIVFGFFFSVVSSRITGELGSSSNPVSGMAIATLMGVCLIFVMLGWTGHAFTAAALSIGAVVCIAASNAGTTSQDLKTELPGGRHALAAADRADRGRDHQRAGDRLDAAVREPGLPLGAAGGLRRGAARGRRCARRDARRRRVPPGPRRRPRGHPGRRVPGGRDRPGALPHPARDRIGEGGGAAGHADEPGDEGDPHAATPLGPRPAGRLHLHPDGDHRRARAGLRGGHVPAAGEHDARVPGRPGPQAGRPPAAAARASRTPGPVSSSAPVWWPAAPSWGSFAVALASPEFAKISRVLAFDKQMLPGRVGFLAFLAVAYLIYRTALKAKPAVDVKHG